MASKTSLHFPMQWVSDNPYSVVLVVAIALVVSYYARHDSKWSKLPPQVPGWPIVNQTFYHMQDDLATNAIKWTNELGEIYRTKTGTTNWIWLNSPEAIKDLIDRKSHIYSSRQLNPMGFQAASGGRRVVFMPYSRQWRTIRTIIHKLLTPNMAKSYAPIQEYEAKQLSVDLLDNPNDFYMHNRRYAASLILQITYGRRLPKWDCEEMTKIMTVLKRFGAIRRPGQWLVDAFPPLADFPLFDWVSNWREYGNEVHKADSAIWMDFWNNMIKEVQAGTAPYSFGKLFSESGFESEGLDTLQAAYVLGTMIEAGSDTTSTQLNNTIVGVLSRGRAVVEAAWAELDAVVGSDRTPDFEDEPNLPYIRGMVKEVMRWRFVNKFGTNHYAMQDDWYTTRDGKTYFIPKGSTVMINIWGLHYNPKHHPDPEKYEPMRFYGHKLSAAESAVAADPNDRDHYSYGGGRRICPGMHVAERSLFLDIARLLWAFDVRLAKDDNGIDIPVDSTFTGFVPGATATPKLFKCDIRVRSPKHEKVLREEWAEAQKNGIDFSGVKYSAYKKKNDEASTF